MKNAIQPGRPSPLGATVTGDGTNFALFSRHATAITLELFDGEPGKRPGESPRLRVRLDPTRHRSGDIWHVLIEGVGDGQLYGYRVDGPYEPLGAGHRFNRHKLLADPYARGTVSRYDSSSDTLYGFDRAAEDSDLSFSRKDSAAATVRSMVMGERPFDWQGVERPRRPLDQTLIYEVHAKGISASRHSSVEGSDRGSYLGVVRKIPQLLSLGVTAVELLPVHGFNPSDKMLSDPETGEPLTNYWGYSSLEFFAPHRAYASSDDPRVALDEFRTMARELHRAGIEVYLDVVYNHTAEGDQNGPTISFRGLDNTVYYHLDPSGRYTMNYSGCGNALNCSHPAVKQLILDSLRYWHLELGVDGFRFDLAAILGRGYDGGWIGDYGLLRDIADDPLLADCKLIGESWDAAGLYTVGQLPGRFCEWNGRFRDAVRRYVRGDQGMVAELALRLGGSPDLFAAKDSPARSINFVTCHDGFTLRDLVSYVDKRNERNGEDNRDGSDHNCSANWGKEGETKHPRIRRLRRQQAKNMLVTLALARGTPMLLGGDELWRTQQGNNNAYCQDNELAWIDWRETDEGAEMTRFARELWAFRRRHPSLARPLFAQPLPPRGDDGGPDDHHDDKARAEHPEAVQTDAHHHDQGDAGRPHNNTPARDSEGGDAQDATAELTLRSGADRNFIPPDDISFHGVHPNTADWSAHALALAMRIHGAAPEAAPGTDDNELYALFNSWSEAIEFTLPELDDERSWHRVIDTSLAEPDEIVGDEDTAEALDEATYPLPAHSVAVLVAR
jgi:isoamylase